MAISSVPSSRVSDLLVRQRLLTQLQSNQSALLDAQTALATGKRFAIPSQNAPASLRAIDIQKLLERKEQVKSNLATNETYLAAADSAVSTVSSLLAEARGVALSAIGSGNSQQGKQTAVQQVQNLLEQLVDIGNQQFRGRYLFAGANTTQTPFHLRSDSVEYLGDETLLLSYSDIDVLLSTNVPGSEIFGAISQPVRGGADLNPRVTEKTRLAELHLGQGAPLGSIAVSDGTVSSIVDLSGAETLGDVAALIERHPPAGRQVHATIGGNGLHIRLLETVPPTGGSLSIREVGGGTTARDLGIFSPTGVGLGTIVGSDLNPRLTLTTPLDNLLGVQASARIEFAGANNDLIIEANERGPQFNDVTISLVDGGPGTAGAESAVYDASDPLNKTLIITIEHAVTSPQGVIAALAGTPFSARLDPRERTPVGNSAVQSTVENPQASAVTAGGSGQELDQAGGVQIFNGGKLFLIDISAAQTIEDLLNQFNRSEGGVVAQINAAGTGVDVRSRLNGTDFWIGENGGVTAAQLGIRSFTETTRLADLNHGLGVQNVPGTDFTIRRKDNVSLHVDIDGAQTIADVLNIINTHPQQDANPLKRVTARLAAAGNGIELLTTDPAVDASFAVLPAGSTTAVDLGLIPPGQISSAAATVSGGTELITGRDVNPQESRGAFAALVRLRDALRGDDPGQIERAIGLLDDAALDMGFSRAELGARLQSLDTLQVRLESEELELKGALSQEIDIDLAEAISSFTALQAAFQASLQSTAQVAQLTLLDFI